MIKMFIFVDISITITFFINYIKLNAYEKNPISTDRIHYCGECLG